MIRNILIIALLLSLLTACEPRSERNQQLLREMQAEKQKIELLRKNIYEISHEMDVIWTRSLKYRFPQIQEIHISKVDLNIEALPYLKGIEFKFARSQKLDVFFTYKSDKKANPCFTLLLFSSDGVNIHRQDIIHSGMISSYLKPDKERIDREKIAILGPQIPQFFLLLPLKEK